MEQQISAIYYQRILISWDTESVVAEIRTTETSCVAELMRMYQRLTERG